MNNLASRIKLVMKINNLSYQQLADGAQVSRQTVYNWLSGASIREENAKRIAAKYGYDWQWIMRGEGTSSNLLDAAKLLIRTSGGIAAIFRGFDLYYIEATDPIVRFTGRDRAYLERDSFYNRMLVPDRQTLEANLRDLVSGKINAYNFMTQRQSAASGSIASLLISVLHLSGVESTQPHFLFIGMPISNSEGLAPAEVLKSPVHNVMTPSPGA